MNTPETSTVTKTLLASLITLAFAGCAVQPKAITPQERQASASADRVAMFAQQEPVQATISGTLAA